MKSHHRIPALVLASMLLLAGGFIAGYLFIPREIPPESPSEVVSPPERVATLPSGPRLVIASARYGDLPDGPAEDVSGRVKAAFDGSQLSIAASNDLFGDPASGIVKKLRVDFVLDGMARSRTVNEGETLRITVPTRPARLVIKKAVYGDLPDGAAIDVTEKVDTALDADTLSIAASNDNFGDPASGIVKKLRVDYTFNGKAKTKTVDENAVFTLSADGE